MKLILVHVWVYILLSIKALVSGIIESASKNYMKIGFVAVELTELRMPIW